MTSKAHKDINGNYIYSDDLIFDEQEDEQYTYNDWLLSPKKYYEQILKENQYIYNQLVKEQQN